MKRKTSRFYQGEEEHPRTPERWIPLFIDDWNENFRAKNLNRNRFVPITFEIDMIRCLIDRLSSNEDQKEIAEDTRKISVLLRTTLFDDRCYSGTLIRLRIKTKKNIDTARFMSHMRHIPSDFFFSGCRQTEMRCRERDDDDDNEEIKQFLCDFAFTFSFLLVAKHWFWHRWNSFPQRISLQQSLLDSLDVVFLSLFSSRDIRRYLQWEATKAEISTSIGC